MRDDDRTVKSFISKFCRLNPQSFRRMPFCLRAGQYSGDINVVFRGK